MTNEKENHMTKEENELNEENKANKTSQEENQAENKEQVSIELEKKLVEMTEEKDKSHQNYLRALADNQNLRKRHSKEKEDTLKYGSETLFKEILPVLDSMEQAFKENPSQQDKEAQLSSLKDGVELISKKLFQALEKHGLAPISANNCSYDPTLHQAVQTQTSEEVSEPTVKEELMKGYELNGRLLRPSMVSVLLPETKKDTPKN